MKNLMMQIFVILSFSAPALGSDRILIQYGDRQIFFEISKSAKEYQIQRKINGVKSETRTLTSKDYKYLSSRFKKITGPSNRKQFCARNYIDANIGGKNLMGCLGAPNKTAEEMQKIANLLQAASF